MSLDALRGFDMFWILGADALAHALGRMANAGPAQSLARQLEHVQWEGFHFYDLIFPLFVFILALIYYGGIRNGWEEIRWVGVLQRIALCYLFTGLAFCFLRPRSLAILCTVLLAGYWALMTFVPFPDVRPSSGQGGVVNAEAGFTNVAQLNLQSTTQLRGVFLEGVNLANYVDQRFLPGHRWDGTWDPEGLLSTLPAIATCLLGVFAGLILQSASTSSARKVLWLSLGGLGSLAVGLLWSGSFPIIKKIWTSSFVLLAGGYSALLLAVFYQVVDVWKLQRWCQPFVWIGTNSITVYLASQFVGFDDLAARIVGGNVRDILNQQVLEGFGDLVQAAVALGLALLLVRFLHHRKIFLRL
jgi:predicted acyltransferase